MKHTAIVAILALGAALLGTPTSAATAQSDDARVCGRVDVPASYILRLSLMRPNAGNVISATAGDEYVLTTVNLDGTFCFKNLRPELHRLQAFGDGSHFRQMVMPVEGKTVDTFLWSSAFWWND